MTHQDIALHVHDIGLRVTVQDLGRPGLAHLGVPTAGAADRASMQQANALVGNPAHAAALEIVLRGMTLHLEGATRIAVVGAPWSVNGTAAASGTAVDVGNDAVVSVGNCDGAYAYLAVAGGVDVASVLGSRSTDTLSQLGPQPAQPGAVLPVGNATGTTDTTGTTQSAPLRVVFGPRDDWFTTDAHEALLTAEWTVTPSSDRIGLRLSGPALERQVHDELPSEGLVAGAVQVPPDGQPILFLANHPTTGGYPVIAVVVSADVDRAAQHRPGMTVRFAAHD